jgi:hypothetical protein
MNTYVTTIGSNTCLQLFGTSESSAEPKNVRILIQSQGCLMIAVFTEECEVAVRC